MKSITCQSCGLPFTKSISGHYPDGSLSEEFCINCFKDGEFVEQSLSLHQLEVRLYKMAKIKKEISIQEAHQVVRILLNLKRWKMNNL